MPSEWDVVETNSSSSESGWEVADQKAPQKSWLQRISSWVVPEVKPIPSLKSEPYGETQERIANTEGIAAKKAGEVAIEYSPITGIPEIGSGIKGVISPGKGTNRRQAGRKIISGIGKTLAPLAVPAALAAPVATAAGIAGGMVVQQGTERGLRAVGVDKDTAGLVGDVAGFIPPGAAARRVMSAIRKPTAPPVPVPTPAPAATPPIPTPSPLTDDALKTLVAIEKDPRKLGLLRATAIGRDLDIPAPKPIEPYVPLADKPDYYGMFDQAERALQKRQRKAAAAKPEVPATGIPEGVARATDARDRLAKEMAGKPFKELNNPERLVIDDLIREGAGQSTAPAVPMPAPMKPLRGGRTRRNSERGAIAVSREEAEAALRNAKDFTVRSAINAADNQDQESGLLKRLVSDERGSLTIPIADIKAGAQKLRTQLTDEFAPVRDLTKPANLPVADDPYVGMRLYAGHAGKIDNRLKSLQGILKPANAEGLLEPIRKYAVYERHEELGARIPGYKLPNGQTLADIQAEKTALEASLGPQSLAKVKSYVDGIRQYSDRLLTEAKDAGIISDKSYNSIKASNQKYVPLQRLEYVADQLDKVPHGSKVFSVGKQDVVQRIQGSDKEILDPLQALIRNTYKTVGLIERNKVAEQMANLANRPEFQGVISPLGRKTTLRPGNEKFAVLRNGVKQEFEAPLNVVEAMKGLNRKEADLVTKMASVSSGALRAGATSLNLPFLASNVIRDYQTAQLVSKVGFSPLDWAKGFAAAVKRGKEFEGFMESGGSFSGFFERNQSLPTSVRALSESAGAKVLKTVAQPWELLRLAAETTELAPRIGVYMRSKSKGLSQAEAGFNARNATVDFAKVGTSMRVLNQWVPFLNARLQGTINTLGTVKDRPGHAALTLSAMVGLPVLSTWSWNRQFGDVTADMAPFEKESNFVVIYGNEKDESGNYKQAIKIPKGDVGRIFGNPLENFLAYIEGKDPKAADQLAMQVMSDISPVSFEKEGKFSGSAIMSSGLPPTVKAGVEGVTNKNLYTEREIVPKQLQDASPAEQYKADTPSWLVKLGEFTNISPLKWQNAIGTQFGGLGRQLADPGKALGAIQGRFVGARGGEQQQKEWDVLAESKREAADVRVRDERSAKQLHDRLTKLAPEERRRLIESGISDKSITPEILEKLGAILEKTESTALDRNLKSSSAESRARYMLKRLNASNPDQRRSLFEQWQQQDLITPKVIEALEAQLSAQ